MKIEAGEFKIDTDQAVDRKKLLSWTLIAQGMIIGLIITAAIKPKSFVQAVEDLFKLLHEKFNDLYLLLVGPHDEFEVALANIQKLATSIARRIQWWAILYLFGLLIALGSYASGRWWGVGFFVLFVLAFIPYVFVVLLNTRVLYFIIQPIAFLTGYMIVLAAALATFNDSAGLPIATRLVWALLLLILPITNAMIGRRGALGPALFAFMAIAWMGILVSTPISSAIARKAMWYTTKGYVRPGKVRLYVHPIDPSTNAIDETKIVAEDGEGGLQVNVKDDGDAIEKLMTLAANDMGLAIENLRGIYIPEPGNPTPQKAVIAAEDLWQPGFLEYMSAITIPWGKPPMEPSWVRNTGTTASGGPGGIGATARGIASASMAPTPFAPPVRSPAVTVKLVCGSTGLPTNPEWAITSGKHDGTWTDLVISATGTHLTMPNKYVHFGIFGSSYGVPPPSDLKIDFGLIDPATGVVTSLTATYLNGVLVNQGVTLDQGNFKFKPASPDDVGRKIVAKTF